MSKSKHVDDDEVIAFSFRKKEPKTTNETIKPHSKSSLSIRFVLLLAHQLNTIVGTKSIQEFSRYCSKGRNDQSQSHTDSGCRIPRSTNSGRNPALTRSFHSY